MMIEKWRAEILLRVFLWLGKCLFEVVASWTDEYGNTSVVYFADSVRDLNTGTRDFVEMLDQPQQKE